MTKKRASIPWLWIGAGLAVVALLVAGHFLPLGEWLTDVQRRVGRMGALGGVVFALAYVVAALLFVPGAALTLGAGAVFGLGWGLVVASAASTVTAAAAFLIARYLARDAFVARLAGTAAFTRLSGMLEAHDWVVIPLLRVLPIAPFAVVNYGLGLTAIPFWRYTAWSLLGMIPMNVVLVLGADLFYTVATRGTVPRPLVAVAVAALLLLAGLAAAGRKAVARP